VITKYLVFEDQRRPSGLGVFGFGLSDQGERSIDIASGRRQARTVDEQESTPGRVSG
jgi:hypothetical protein